MMKTQPGSRNAILIFFLLLSTPLCASIQAEDALPVPPVQESETAAATAPSPAVPPVEVPAPPVTPADEVPPSLEAEAPETNSQFRPEVIITQVGEELNLKVKYPHPMDFKNGDAIEYVRMESLPGEFLGLMTYNDKFTEASAEFMINPKLANFDQVRLVAKSSKAGLIKSIHKLELTPVAPPPEPEITTPVQTPERASSRDKSRKRILGLF